MSKARELADNAGNIDVPKNLIINGGFDIQQRATAQTTSGYGSDDRWANSNGGSTKTHSLQLFTLGQTDVAGNPKYYSRTTVVSVAGAANYAQKRQSVEGVTTLAGKTATLTFWAKADASKDIAVELFQLFGTGGSPSAAVGITPQTVTLTTSWVKHSLTFAVPSVSGKTLGTNGDDYFGVNFWFDAGSDYNSSTNSLGQQSGTFDIARVSLCEGDVTALDDPFKERTLGEELALCQRYFTEVTVSAQSGGVGFMIVPWRTVATMRVTPTNAIIAAGSTNNATAVTDAVQSGDGGYFQIQTTAASGFVLNRKYRLDAEL